MIVKKVFIVVAIAAVITGLYFGAYLPYKKASSFISVIRSFQSVQSIEGLKSRFDSILNINSPVARDETRGFVMDQLSNILREGLPEDVGQLIVGYAEEVADPVLSNSESSELTKMILKMGIVYQRAWLIYGNPVYADRVEEMYLRGLEISPNRSQFLYGLLDLYLSEGRIKEAVEVGEKIAALWPTDLSLKEKLQLLIASQ